MRPSPRMLRCAGLLAGLVLIAPISALAGGSHGKSSSSYGWTSDDPGDRFAWGLLDAEGGHSAFDTDGGDWEEIRRLMRDEDLPVFWFRLSGRNYVVRDRAMVENAHELAEPIRDLGRKQGALGARQGALGVKQSDLGQKQAELGTRQARLSARLSRLAYAESSDENRALRAERREVEAALNETSRQQGLLGQEQGRLGAIQGELGRQQGELGREQARLGKVVGAEMRKLAEDAIRQGKAEPVGRKRSI